jgi:hypothetical protein
VLFDLKHDGSNFKAFQALLTKKKILNKLPATILAATITGGSRN